MKNPYRIIQSLFSSPQQESAGTRNLNPFPISKTNADAEHPFNLLTRLYEPKLEPADSKIKSNQKNVTRVTKNINSNFKVHPLERSQLSGT